MSLLSFSSVKRLTGQEETRVKMESKGSSAETSSSKKLIQML